MVNVNPVIAKISLDASEFKKELESLETQLNTFKTNFRSQGGKGFNDAEIKKTVEEYVNGMNKVKEANDKIKKQDPWKEQVNRFKQYEGQIRNLQSLINDFKGVEGKEELSVYNTRLNEMAGKLREIKAITNDEKWYSPNQLKSALNSLESSLNRIQSKTSNIVSAPKIRFESLNNELKKFKQLVRETSVDDGFKESHYQNVDRLSEGLQRVARNYEQGVYSEKEFVDSLKLGEKELEKYNRLLLQQESLIKTSGGKTKKSNVTFDNLKEKIGRITQFDVPEAEVQKLNNAMVELNRMQNQGITTGERYNQLLNRTNQQYNKVARSAIDAEMEFKKVNQAMNIKTETSNSFKKLQKDITTLKTSLNTLGTAQFTTPITQLNELDTKLQLMKEHINEGKITWKQYQEILELISKEFNLINRESLGAVIGFNNISNGIRKSELGIMGFSRKLYKLRGLMISFRTLLSVTGSMMLYDYAFRIFNSIGDTLKAKSEMESQLAINTHAGTRSILQFNHALDQTAQKFQKINKYQLGETVTSIGLEFDLSTEQMKKVIPVIAMISNEYIRAGRTAEEAALAVKDVLQGEFRRLSMETGVGKEELIKAGWSGDNKDIMSLLSALEKIGHSRHWEAFASKASSLNDVLTITQNRLSETGARIADNFTPLVTGAFNSLVGVVDNVVNSFGKLTAVQQFLVEGGLIYGLSRLGTVVFGLNKNVSLLTVVSTGLRNTLGSVIFKLDQNSVAQHGFWKTLTLTKTGVDDTNDSLRHNIKLLAGHVLGLKSEIVHTEGFWKALVYARAELKNEADVMTQATRASMSFRDKLLYVVTGLKYNQIEGKKLTTVLKNLIFSWSILGKVLKWSMIIGVGFWLAGIAEQAKRTHDRIKEFHDLINSGNDKLNDAKNKLQEYQNTMKKIGDKNNPYYKIAEANAKVQEANIKALDGAIPKFDEYDKKLKKLGKRNIDKAMANRVDVLKATGYSFDQASEAASNYTNIMETGYSLEKNAYKLEKQYNDESAAHAKSQIEYFKNINKEQGKTVYTQKELADYGNEYLTVAEETNRQWKEFHKGNLIAGAYAGMGELHEAWIDLMMNKDINSSWNNINKAVSGFIPIGKQVAGWLIRLGGELSKLVNWIEKHPLARNIASIGIAGGLLGAGLVKLGGKIFDFGKNIKSSWDTLKGFKDTLTSVIDKFRKNKDVISQLPSPLPEDVRSKRGKIDLPSPLPEDKLSDKNKIGFWENMRQTIRDYGKILGHLAGATVIVMAGIGAIALVGAEYKALESQIKDGVKAFSEIWPVLIAVLAPVTAFTVAMEKFNVVNKSFSRGNMWKTAGAIAGTLALTAEALFMILPSLLAISTLGSYKENTGDSIRKGIEVINETKDVLIAIAVPVGLLWGALSVVGEAIAEPAVIGFVATALVIAGGLLLIAEAIAGLQMPLGQIANLGEKYKINGDDVKRGITAIKDTMTSLNYLSVIFSDIVIIEVNNLIKNAMELSGKDLQSALGSLIKDDNTGALDVLSTFAKSFNKKEFTPIGSEKAQSLTTSASSITSIAEGIRQLNTAMNNLPSLNNDTSDIDSIALTNSKTSKKLKGEATTDTQNKLDALLEPIHNIKDFISKITGEEYNIDTSGLQDKITAVTDVTQLISQLQFATQNLKMTLQNAGDAEYQRAGARGGTIMAELGSLIHSTADGDYKSSIGKSLIELENIVDDLFTFNNRIQTKSTGINENSDTNNKFSAFITSIENQINQIKTVIDNAKNGDNGLYEKGKSLGETIIKGFSEGVKGADEKARTAGRNMGANFADGFKFKAHLAVSFTNDEITNIITKINERKSEVGQAGRSLGEEFAKGYKQGAGISSPGFAARATEAEINYISDYLQRGINNLPVLANQFGQVISQGMTPTPVDLPQLNMPMLQEGDVKPLSEQLLGDENTLQTQLDRISPTLNTIRDKFTVDFHTIRDTVNSSFSSMGENTKLNMQGMLNSTTGHINRILVSWHGLQTALINSAETIRSQVTSKVNKIKTNMGDFWKKINNPTLLVSGSAGNPSLSSAPRRRGGGFRSSSTGFKLPPIMSAGNILNINRLQGKDILEYLKCLLSGSRNCYAGGWNYNWTPKIESKYSQWKTHFGKYSIDDHVNVGKFKNSNFPVKGIKQIALDYIKSIIGSTDYDFYWDYHYDPVSALKRGAFNCMDGARLIIALANAFGFGGGSIGHTTWNGIGHGYARIPGLGVLDATAIQQRGSFRASGVRYAGGGSVTHNHNTKGDVNVTVVIEGDVNGSDGFREWLVEVAEEVFNGKMKDIVMG